MDLERALSLTRWAAWLLGGLSLLLGWQTLRAARQVRFFRMRYERVRRGWRWLTVGVGLWLLAGLVLPRWGRALAYRIWNPTPTPTPSPTATWTPTATPIPSVTPTPTITPTLAGTPTPSPTPTAYIPEEVRAEFESTATPPPDVIFSPLTFTQGLDPETFRPLNPGEVFYNPVGHLYALFSYDRMADGVQWTALWYRNGELVHYETRPWEWGTGGWGYTDWNPEPTEWLPGQYTVYIFVGDRLITSGSFVVEGDPPTPTPPPVTPTPTAPPATPTPTSGTPASGQAATGTPSPTVAAPNPDTWPTPTPSPTRTPFGGG